MYKALITLFILVQLFANIECMKSKEKIDQCIAVSILLPIAIPFCFMQENFCQYYC
ncbi:hypothetical protein CRM22_010024 [Opisthorchis felineus]|uniref:Late nodulin n=1 Tax=Opisthorchis felineus TaxID=147828 RepID=A0A4S2L9R2_OPIFE|nr:hypothetical protein CRM22_010024 [Opisthorchis felineus]